MCDHLVNCLSLNRLVVQNFILFTDALKTQRSGSHFLTIAHCYTTHQLRRRRPHYHQYRHHHCLNFDSTGVFASANNNRCSCSLSHLHRSTLVKHHRVHVLAAGNDQHQATGHCWY